MLRFQWTQLAPRMSILTQVCTHSTKQQVRLASPQEAFGTGQPLKV